MIDVVALRQPRSQHWVAAQSGVSRQTLRNLSRIGLLPPARQLTGSDVVLARCARALGATRSTNRRAQAGEWTEAALERDRNLIKTVRDLLNSGEVDARTTVVVYPDKCEATAVLEAVSEWIHTDEDAEHLVLLPLGKWALAVPGSVDRPSGGLGGGGIGERRLSAGEGEGACSQSRHPLGLSEATPQNTR